MADEVYEQHKATVREAYNHTPDREAQGHYIAQMKKYAGTEVSEKNADRVRGSIFNDLTYACNFIGVSEKIRKDQVYPALRMIGANQCYHTFKEMEKDIFSEIQSLVERCTTSKDRDLWRIGEEEHPIFHEVKSKVYRVENTTKAVMVKQAAGCGIKTPDLNLYHALHGLKLIVENEPTYILMAEDEIFMDPLRVLYKADKSLLLRKKMLTAALE